MRHVALTALPYGVQATLAMLGYGRKDIAIHPAESFSLACGGEKGCRAFVCVYDLESGTHKTTHGSWGGANMFNPRNAVDLDTTSRPLPPNVLVIEGSEGGGRPVYASISCHPSTLAPLLPAPQSIDDRDARILACYRSLKSGPYRKEALARLKCSDADITRLCAAGLLKRSSNGATAITTDGKNACASVSTASVF